MRHCIRTIAALLITLGILLLLVSCGAAPQATNPSPVVVTQLVPQTVVVTQLATVVVTATPLPATPLPPTPMPLPKAGQWEVVTDTSSFDDSQRVVLSLAAEGTIETGFGTQQPTLILRCQEGATEAYIVTGTPPDVEADNLDGATVRLRFDRAAAETLVMSKSTDDTALFFEDAAIIEIMLQHEQLLFEFTPFNMPPTEVTFDLRGLSEAIIPLRAACAA